MGFFDSLGSAFAPDIQGPGKAGLDFGYAGAAPFLSAGFNNINQGYNAAIPTLRTGTAEQLPYLQSVFSTGRTGTDALLGALGLGGAAGTQGALQALRGTPGYEFTLGQGLEGIERTRAAGGQLASGGTQAAGAEYASGLADKTYQSYVQNLMPFLNTLTQGATGAANILGQGATNVAGLQTGQGQALATQGNIQAQLPWTYGTQLGALGAQQATANANYGLAGIMGLGNLAGNIFSDERLKENIEPIGKTYDGLGVFRYNYLWDETPRIGLLAQDVEKRTPEAVSEIAGFKTVNYGRATSRAAQLARFLEAA